MIRAFVLAFIVSALLVGACGQNRKSVVGPDEISLKFRWLFRQGETTIQRIPVGRVPNAPLLPTGYAMVEGRNYVITSSIIGSSGILTVMLPAQSEAEFNEIRILELDRDELVPGGYEWRDCTMLPKTLEGAYLPVQPEYRQYVEGYNIEMAKYFPDFRTKKVSCEPGMYGGNG